jgi:HSP20 family protein
MEIAPSTFRSTQKRETGIADWPTTDFDRVIDDLRRSMREFEASLEGLTGTPLMEAFEPLLPKTVPTRAPIVEFRDNGDSYSVIAQLLGFTKDQVDVKVSRESLEIVAESRAEKNQRRENYIRKERAYSAFRKAVTFPEGVVASEAEATMKGGIIEVRVPKKHKLEGMKRVTVK